MEWETLTLRSLEGQEPLFKLLAESCLLVIINLYKVETST